MDHGSQPVETQASTRHLSAAQSVHHGGPVRRFLRHLVSQRRALRGGGARHLRGHDPRWLRWPRGAHDQHPDRIRRRVRQPVGHGRLRCRAGAGGLRVGLGWARQAGVVGGLRLYACAALRLARFNTQIGIADKRYFQGLASPSAAAIIAGRSGSATTTASPARRQFDRGGADRRRRTADGQQLPLPQLQGAGSARTRALRGHGGGHAGLRAGGAGPAHRAVPAVSRLRRVRACLHLGAAAPASGAASARGYARSGCAHEAFAEFVVVDLDVWGDLDHG
jgi:hypothetical protein